MHPCQRGDLHCGEYRVTHDGGHNSQPDRDFLGQGEGGCRWSDAAPVKTVFDHPEFLVAGRFDAASEAG